MPTRNDFPVVFDELKAILRPYAPHLLVEADAPDHYSLDAPGSVEHPKGLFFGGVRVGKRYVSYHLMPVYLFPDLLDGASERLRKQMQGKSCFNFTASGDDTIAELRELTAAGYERYRGAQLL